MKVQPTPVRPQMGQTVEEREKRLVLPLCKGQAGAAHLSPYLLWQRILLLDQISKTQFFQLGQRHQRGDGYHPG